MKKLTIRKVEGGYLLSKDDTIAENVNSVHVSLNSLFDKLLNLYEDRTEKGKGDYYGKVIIKRVKDVSSDIIDKHKKVIDLLRPLQEPIEDIIKFEDMGAVEKIKEVEKNEK